MFTHMLGTQHSPYAYKARTLPTEQSLQPHSYPLITIQAQCYCSIIQARKWPWNQLSIQILNLFLGLPLMPVLCWSMCHVAGLPLLEQLFGCGLQAQWPHKNEDAWHSAEWGQYASFRGNHTTHVSKLLPLIEKSISILLPLIEKSLSPRKGRLNLSQGNTGEVKTFNTALGIGQSRSVAIIAGYVEPSKHQIGRFFPCLLFSASSPQTSSI